MNIVMFLAELSVKPLPAAENPLTVMLRFLVGIAVVFLLLWLLYRWVKRTNLGDYQGPGLRLISRLALTRSAMVAVVEIGGRMFLVGAGDSAVTPIAELYDTEEMATELDSQVAASARSPVKKPFGQVLARVSRKAPAGEPEGEEVASTMAISTSAASGSGARPQPVAGSPTSNQSASRQLPRGKNPGRTAGSSAKASSGSTRVAPESSSGKPVSPGASRAASVSRAKQPTGPSPENPIRATKNQSGSAPRGVAPETAPPKPQVTEAQMDALAAQIAAEFGVRPTKPGEST